MLKKVNFYLIIIILISLIPLLGFLKTGLPITHDGQDHVARVANFYQSLSEGNIIPRWAGNLNWGYGHPVLMFLYPLPSYFASLFHSLGFSFVDSTKAVFALSFMFSGIFIFLWIREIWGSPAGLAAGLVYLFAPYRFVDLYVRGAIGECWAFVWPPLACYFVLKFSRELKWRYLAGGSLSLAALILSHNALSLMFLPVILGYLGYLVYTMPEKKRFSFIIHYSLFIIFGFALASFFWLPAFAEGKYTLRDIVTKGNITGFESFSRLFYSDWNYGGSGSFSVQLGFIQWLTVILAPLLIWKLKSRKDNYWVFLSFLFICFLGGIFLILPFSQPVYFKITLLQKFQFAWRFLSLAIFPPAVFAGLLVYLLSKKLKPLALCALLFTLLILNKDYWHPKGYLNKNESFFTQKYVGTTDTGESAPRWSVRFMEKYPKEPLEVIDGSARIQTVSRTTNVHRFLIETDTNSRLVENTLYFPGWQILVDGLPVSVEFQNPDYRGLMTFNVSAGKHQVTTNFKETKLRLFADLISLIGLLGLLIGGKIRTSRKFD